MVSHQSGLKTQGFTVYMYYKDEVYALFNYDTIVMQPNHPM